MPDTLYPADPVLLVDDEPEILSAAEVALAVRGIANVVTCSRSSEVAGLVSSSPYSVVSLDLVMPDVGGADLVPVIQEALPDAVILVATGIDDVETAVDLMKLGVSDYLVKPVDTHRLVATVRRAIETYEMRQENRSLRDHVLSGSLRTPEAFEHILTRDDRMFGIFGYVEAIAPTSLPVLITGETGVGKELLAESVHRASGRSGEFVAVNTAGLDDQLFSDTLFGHVKGAFTGSSSDRQGMIARASGGTLFLDEIGDLTPESQIKLLRLTQQREYYPLGSDTVLRSDARLVFATNKDLERLVKEGGFRQDLYYRLRSHRIVIPPLRERQQDILLLAHLFLERAAEETGKPVPTVPSELATYLRLHEFPGNVRELEGVIYDAVVRHKSGTLSLELFGDALTRRPGEPQEVAPERVMQAGRGGSIFSGVSQLPTLKDTVDDLIQEALDRAGGNQTAAARVLGMTRTALNKRLSRADSE